MIVQPFDWKKLTSAATVEYRVNSTRQIEVREPFPVSLEYEWKGLVLRTSGAPLTMRRIVSALGVLVASAEERTSVDRRVLFSTIACESGHDASESSGRSLQSPRTEINYPRREGENDPGDEERDALDWTKSGGMHSSHGLMQTLIGTAVSVCPHLFAGVPVERYREVLWNPANSIECGAKYMSTFSFADQADPVRLRFHYGAGGVYPGRNRWGGRMYLRPDGTPAEGPFILNFVAFFNDCVAVLGDVPAPAVA